MHFFMSLMFFGLTIGLVFAYFLIPLWMFLGLRFIVSRRKAKGKDACKQAPVPFFRKKDWRFVGILLLFSTTMNTFIYISQRQEWMSEDNANLTAKEYFVTGQVVYTYRSIATNIIRADNKLLAPFNWLQQLIFETGKEYIPSNDAEIAVWSYNWFVYPYAKRLKAPKQYFFHVRDQQYEKENGFLVPLSNEYMDKVWSCLETMATKEFADRKMYEQQYLRNYAGMSFYYAHVSPQAYSYKVLGSSKPYSQMREMTLRNEKLTVWLIDIAQKWHENKLINDFVNKNPKVEAMREVAMLGTLKHIIQSRPWAKEFQCDDPYFQHYINVRRVFTEGDEGRVPAYTRMKDRKAGTLFYNELINSTAGRFPKYVLSHYCGYELAGKVDMTDYTGRLRMTPDEYEEDIIRNALFNLEINLIEEQINGR